MKIPNESMESAQAALRKGATEEDIRKFVETLPTDVLRSLIKEIRDMLAEEKA